MKLNKSFYVGLLSLCMFSCAGTAPVTARETSDFDYLVEAIYFESGTESVMCKVATAQTIMWRVTKPNWKNTIKDVVHYKSAKGTCHFSYYCDGKPETFDYNSKAYKESYAVANQVLYGNLPDFVERADHFINKNLSSATWYMDMDYIMTCDGHSYFRRDQ